MPREVLLTIAEVAAAFVGFSMVVGLLRPEESDRDARFYTIRDVAEIGLIAAAGAFAPVIIELFGLQEAAVWRLSSLGLALAWFAGMSSSLLRYRALGRSPFYIGTGPGVGITGFALVGQGLLWWNVVSNTGARSRHVRRRSPLATRLCRSHVHCGDVRPAATRGGVAAMDDFLQLAAPMPPLGREEVRELLASEFPELAIREADDGGSIEVAAAHPDVGPLTAEFKPSEIRIFVGPTHSHFEVYEDSAPANTVGAATDYIRAVLTDRMVLWSSLGAGGSYPKEPAARRRVPWPVRRFVWSGPIA